MLRTWTFAKNRPHDASGISNPFDWLWEKDARIGIYYPIERVPETHPEKTHLDETD